MHVTLVWRLCRYLDNVCIYLYVYTYFIWCVQSQKERSRWNHTYFASCILNGKIHTRTNLHSLKHSITNIIYLQSLRDSIEYWWEMRNARYNIQHSVFFINVWKCVLFQLMLKKLYNFEKLCIVSFYYFIQHMRKLQMLKFKYNFYKLQLILADIHSHGVYQYLTYGGPNNNIS